MSNQPPEWPPEGGEQPGDDGLARMFAAEEAAIRDDGFTARVMEQAHNSFGVRRVVVYGAGMAGFGAAVAGIFDMAPYFPAMTGWWGGMSNALQTGAAPDPSNPAFLIMAALAAGAAFFTLALVAQER